MVQVVDIDMSRKSFQTTGSFMGLKCVYCFPFKDLSLFSSRYSWISATLKVIISTLRENKEGLNKLVLFIKLDL